MQQQCNPYYQAPSPRRKVQITDPKDDELERTEKEAQIQALKIQIAFGEVLQQTAGNEETFRESQNQGSSLSLFTSLST